MGNAQSPKMPSASAHQRLQAPSPPALNQAVARSLKRKLLLRISILRYRVRNEIQGNLASGTTEAKRLYVAQSPGHLYLRSPALLLVARRLSYLALRSAAERNETIAVSISSNADILAGASRKKNKPSSIFTCFPNLPVEIRMKIWKEACFQPRVVDSYLTCPGDEEESHYIWHLFDRDQFLTFVTITARRAPAILHTSQEARKIGLENYSLEFGRTGETTVAGDTTLTLTTPPKVYINWNSDIICPTQVLDYVDNEGLGSNGRQELEALKSYQKMRRLAVDIEALDFLKDHLTDFALDEVTVYLAPGIDKWAEFQNVVRDEALEGCCVSCRCRNSNTRFAYRFVDVDVQKIDPLSYKYEMVDPEKDYFDSYIPTVSLYDVKSAYKRVTAVALKLNKVKEAGWKPPRFKVMVMEIHEKDAWAKPRHTS
ncbi:uncharacterized protein PAC_14172 [Phialocephala subalpina]|uniref:2EXR domain-containing protein n=1 Tax=Phialocephala subalpina TaxID=576137 RepID=A0A1L7XGX4_9HELO|nr:uncharacterized protein PAC_14172 [Phialocephala subalpina]